jgi:hypothetical protein
MRLAGREQECKVQKLTKEITQKAYAWVDLYTDLKVTPSYSQLPSKTRQNCGLTMLKQNEVFSFP